MDVYVFHQYSGIPGEMSAKLGTLSGKKYCEI